MVQARQRRPRLGEAAWRELLTRFENGHETVEAFCARQGLSKSTFSRWRSRGIAVAPSESAPPPGSAPQFADAGAGFVDLGALRSPAMNGQRLQIKLDLGSGLVLHVVRG